MMLSTLVRLHCLCALNFSLRGIAALAFSGGWGVCVAAYGAPVIVLLFNGCPVDVGWAQESERVTAMLECFFPAQSAGDALLRTLTMTGGPASVPAARLPATWPRDLHQVSS